MYNNRQEFIEDNISEKITLAHLSFSNRIYDLDLSSTNVYTKKTDFIVIEVKGFTLSSDNDVSIGEYYYDVLNKTLYIGSSDISLEKLIITYRIFLSTAPIVATWDLNDDSIEVEYEPRIESSPSFKSQIGSDQRGISLTNSGNLVLSNNDGFFDKIYDFFIFENKEVDVYSYNRSLKYSESKATFKGNIYDKSYSTDKVTFQLKDRYTRLDEKFPSDIFENDTYNRTIYGKNEGVVVRSIDKIDEGFELTGTISTDINSNIVVTGRDTNFQTQIDGGSLVFNTNDLVEVNSVQYRIVSIDSENQMTIRSIDGSSVEAEEDSMSKITLENKSGSISLSNTNARQVLGVGTTFDTDVSDGDTIFVDGVYLDVDVVISDSELILESNSSFDFNNKSYSIKNEISSNGDVTFYPNNRILIGNSSNFLTEVTPGDELISEQTDLSFVVQRVLSEDQILVDQDSAILFNISSVPFKNKSQSGVNFKNRIFNVCSHHLKEENYSLVEQIQANRVLVSDTKTLRADDVITFSENTDSEVAEVLRVSGNKIILKQNLSRVYTNQVVIFRNPIVNVYIDNKLIDRKNLLSINNLDNNFTFTISNSTELDISSSSNIASNSFLFKSGQRDVDILGNNTIKSIINPRDFIRAYGDSDNLKVEVLEVTDSKILLRSEYEGTSGVKRLTHNKVSIINDETKVSVDCIGKPEGNVIDGKLLTRGPDIVKDILNNSNLQNELNLVSFDNASSNSPYDLGLVIPESVNATSMPSIKSLIDKVNTTVYASMVIDNDLRIRYNILDTELPSDKNLRRIGFDDLINWSIRSKGNDLYLSTIAEYAKNESNESSSFARHTNEVASDFETSIKTQEISLISRSEKQSQELCERNSLISSLSRSEITLDSDLRLSDISMGDKVILDIPRLFRRLGDLESSLKIATVISVTISGERTKLVVSDLGNLYNTTSKITRDDSPSFSEANSNDKAYDSYITDENGTIENNEQLMNNNLIF